MERGDFAEPSHANTRLAVGTLVAAGLVVDEFRYDWHDAPRSETPDLCEPFRRLGDDRVNAEVPVQVVASWSCGW